jgi:hypothetical protein
MDLGSFWVYLVCLHYNVGGFGINCPACNFGHRTIRYASKSNTKYRVHSANMSSHPDLLVSCAPGFLFTADRFVKVHFRRFGTALLYILGHKICR